MKNVRLPLRRGGYFVLFVGRDGGWLDYGGGKARLFPENKESYVKLLRDSGFSI